LPRTLTLTNPNPNPNNNRNLCGTTAVPEIACLAIKYSYDYVGRKLLLPDDRCCAISYVRLLLEDSMLKAHQHGLHVTHECECGQGIEDTYHFLHECTSYVDIRQAFFDEVKNVWKDSSNEGRPTLSVPLLLAPYSGFQLTTPRCHQIVLATFEYIKNSSCRL